MAAPPTPLPAARAVRLMHAALTLGPALAGVVFVIVRRVSPPPQFPGTTTIGLALSVAAIAILAVALTVLRARVPQQAPEQSVDGFWGDAAVRFSALTLWAVVEGATLLGAVGYLLTGALAPGMALALGVVTLLSLRPARFELDE